MNDPTMHTLTRNVSDIERACRPRYEPFAEMRVHMAPMLFLGMKAGQPYTITFEETECRDESCRFTKLTLDATVSRNSDTWAPRLGTVLSVPDHIFRHSAASAFQFVRDRPDPAGIVTRSNMHRTYILHPKPLIVRMWRCLATWLKR